MSPAFSSLVEAFKQDPDWAVKQAPDSQDLIADVSQNWKAYRESTDIHGLQSKYKSSLSRVSHGDVLRNSLGCGHRPLLGPPLLVSCFFEFILSCHVVPGTLFV